jgi:hypothetical protein
MSYRVASLACKKATLKSKIETEKKLTVQEEVHLVFCSVHPYCTTPISVSQDSPFNYIFKSYINSVVFLCPPLAKKTLRKSHKIKIIARN